ncbi:MAG TPA: MmgE/PrpD family protein [Streptosporangiaceae bacterium]|nr:MmgE/PrpD family protein [Streptosporangiaceae bacterium]
MDQVLRTLTDIVEAGRRPQPGAAMHGAKRMLLDSIGCALGSYREQVPAIARSVSARRARPSGARVFGGARRLHPDAAAFANSVMIRFLDYNDTYGSTVGVGHPSDYIPAAMAQFGADEIPGDLILRSMLVGYEVFCRLTDATRLGVERIDHVLNGAVASAAAASVANGLTAEHTRHALSLAVTANLSLQATRLGELSMWKGCAAGNACRNGVFAAELAASGITGPDSPFTGRGGLCQVTGREIDFQPLVAADGPAIMRCHVKRFPSGYFSQGAIEAALAVRAQLAGRIPAAVEVGTFEFGKRVMAGDTQKWHPATRETADHSIPYVVACALARGAVRRDDLAESQFADPHIRRLLDILTVEVDTECAAAWPEACMNRVTARFGDGSQVSDSVRYYRGHALNPLSDSELEAKFRDQAGSVILAEDADALVKAVWMLDEAGSAAGLFAWTASSEATARPGKEIPGAD